ncbi:MAG: chemotaxis protein CheD [Proteobacteria bacterium]|nr:chemotaxis protein CheD [Pseudomonadota bacterium]
MKSSTHEKVFLKAGEVLIAEKPSRIYTILGSCVAVIMFSPRTGIGAICHAQLAENKETSSRCSDTCPVKCFTQVSKTTQFKYVSCSIRYMVDQFEKRGISKKEIDVKLFGGANVLKSGNNQQTIGHQNIETATKILKNMRLEVISHSVGGNTGMTLYFDSNTGIVHLKRHKQGNPWRPLL